MTATLDEIISAIKTVALANGFTSVEEARINLMKSADTELPRMFIRLAGLNYSNFSVDTAQEEYKLELIVIMKTDDTPVSSLKELVDDFLKALFTTNVIFNKLALGGKVKMIESDLTNDRDIYSRFGGEGCTIKMNIFAINNFGNVC